MKPALETLEPRDCPSPIRPGDFVQGQAADCAFLATCAAAAGAGVDLSARVHKLSAYRWRVDLFAPSGLPREVGVHFDGSVTRLDPAVLGGDFRALLLARAHLRLAPWAVSRGESLEMAEGILMGQGPEEDALARNVGLAALRSALERGSPVVCCSACHAYAVLAVTDHVVTLYDPWGAIRRVPAAAFLRKPFEVVIDA